MTGRAGLHAHWYRRLLVLWIFTGLPLLVLANIHSPTWFFVVPGAPPISEGMYPTVSWAAMVLIIWQPILLLPFALRTRRSKDKNA